MLIPLSKLFFLCLHSRFCVFDFSEGWNVLGRVCVCVCVCVCVYMHIYQLCIICDSWLCVLVSVINSQTFLAIFNSNISCYFLKYCYFNYLHVRSFRIIPYFPMLWLLFFIFSLFAAWEASIDLSLSSLIIA